MLHISGLSFAEKQTICKMLTIANPRRIKEAKYSGWGRTTEPKELLGYANLPDDAILVAPGAGKAVWDLLVSGGRRPQYRNELGHALMPEVLVEYRGQSRDYQDVVVDSMLLRQNAVAIGPCGSGKTDSSLRVMAGRACPWLIMVHMRGLAKQWQERIEERMWAKIGTGVSMYSPGKKQRWIPGSPFVIATAQGLREHPEDVVALAAEGRGIWVDECHHTPCSTFVDVVALGAWRYRYGVTATPDRADGTTALMNWWIGPIVARVDRQSVIDSGHLLKPRLMTVVTDYRDTYNPKELGDDQRLRGRMYADTPRTSKIVHAIKNLHEGCRHILVTVDRITFGQDLAYQLNHMGVKTEMCYSKMARQDKDFVMQEVADGRIRVLIATSLADEGLDLPILDTVVLASPSGSPTRTEQRMGRACRPLPGKPEPLVVDVVDPLVQREEVDPETGRTIIHRIFVNQFRSRYQRVYRKMATVDEEAVRRILRRDANNEPARTSSGTQ